LPLEVEAFNYLVMFDEIDPSGGELNSDVGVARPQPVRTITISHEAEPTVDDSDASAPKWKIHFYTETIGDLYLAQGHLRLAAEVFRTLNERNHNHRLAEKLAEAQRRTQSAAPAKEKKKEN
jgi:hypothetical protein